MRLSSPSVNKSYFFTNPQQRCVPAGGFVEVDAFSKINLFLEVEGKMPDGYHQLTMVMQRLELRDRLRISLAPDGQNTMVKLDITNSNLPVDDTNLVVKAAKLIMKEHNITSPIQIKLDKHIPVGAGLGGGSSDAAATLIGLNNLFKLDIPTATLIKMGKTLGADVPFCVFANSRGNSGTAIATGIGELLQPLAPHPQSIVVLACPNVHVSTKEIFHKLTYTEPKRTVNSFIDTYNTGDVSAIAKNFHNRFTKITSEIHPQITALIADLQAESALGASMTGTGATVFAYFNDENNARVACDKLQQKHESVKFFITKVI